MNLSAPSLPANLRALAAPVLRTIRPLSLLFMIVLVLPFLVFAYPPALGAEAGFVVLSGSMEPALHPGDIVVVYDVEPADIRSGDVITFAREGATVPITHRVVEVIETNDDPTGVALRTAGDANEDVDQGLVLGSQVIGRVPSATLPAVGTTLLFIPWLGHVVQFVNTTAGFVILVALPIALFVVNEVLAIARGAERSSPSSLADDGPSMVPANPVDSPDTLESESGGTSTVSLNPSDLTIALGVLIVAGGYAVWVAYAVRTPWAIAVAVAMVGSSLFAAALRHAAGRPTLDPPTADAVQPGSAAVTDGSDDRIVRTAVPRSFDRLPQVPVESHSTLLEYARLVGGLVVEDRDSDVSYLPNGGVLYIAWRDDESTAGGTDRVPRNDETARSTDGETELPPIDASSTRGS